MTGLGLIGVIPAVRRYKEAMKRYNDLVEYKEGVSAAVRSYNLGKRENYESTHIVDEKPNEFAPGLLFSPLLRVGNLVGNLFRCQTSLVLTNAGSDMIKIGQVWVDCKVLDVPVQVFRMTKEDDRFKNYGGLQTVVFVDPEKDDVRVEQTISVNKVINPGETLEIILPAGISGLGDKMGELRNLICDAAGKRLITSCPKLNIDDGIQADIMIDWTFDDPEKQADKKRCYVSNKIGVLRYCGEAFYPKN